MSDNDQDLIDLAVFWLEDIQTAKIAVKRIAAARCTPLDPANVVTLESSRTFLKHAKATYENVPGMAEEAGPELMREIEATLFDS